MKSDAFIIFAFAAFLLALLFKKANTTTVGPTISIGDIQNNVNAGNEFFGDISLSDLIPAFDWNWTFVHTSGQLSNGVWQWVNQFGQSWDPSLGPKPS